ncbi:MAG: rod shape-determining protein MreD [Idiomarina sp.]|nr:rod shape-determining protein MreD [Idiomarina sp.]
MRFSFGQRMVVYLTLLAGLILAVMPMSAGLQAWRPEWALMIVIYWVIALPHRVNIGTCFVIGLATDVLLGSHLGIHAAAYSLIGFIFANHYKRVRNFSLSQQGLFILVMVMVERSIVYLVEYYVNNAQMTSSYFFPALSSAVIWPWLFLLMRKIRRRFGVV